jgi:hypothetical protein
MNSAIAYGQLAEFYFDSRIHKFEAVKAGVNLEHTFEFTNTGKEPLIISNYEVDCPCTKAEYSKEPVMPGQKASIKVSFDTKDKLGWQYRKIALYANTKKSPTHIEIRVRVD